MRLVIFGALCVMTAGAAYADGACQTIADNSAAIRQRDAHSQDIVFTGVDARDFFAEMVGLIGPMAWPADNLNAVSAHLYLAPNSVEVAAVHFYDADRCDVGHEADMAVPLFNLIIAKVGVRI
jgi:hypothetical protein